MVQVPGVALRMPADVFRARVRPDSRLHALLLHYTYCFLAQVSQSVACNARHPVRQRLCRWLLMTHSHARTDRFRLTHAFLADTLGVRRASVTVGVRGLQRKGLIHCTRGEISILDRPGLEAAVCECYLTLREVSERSPSC
jgi:CRP-like cAMP-binding protein